MFSNWPDSVVFSMILIVWFILSETHLLLMSLMQGKTQKLFTTLFSRKSWFSLFKLDWYILFCTEWLESLIWKVIQVKSIFENLNNLWLCNIDFRISLNRILETLEYVEYFKISWNQVLKVLVKLKTFWNQRMDVLQYHEYLRYHIFELWRSWFI